jgi:CheY-like chemotaxis protein
VKSVTAPISQGVHAQRILVVDDEAMVTDLLRDTLQRWGHVATVAYSGEEALRLFDAQPYDMVLTDLRMPGMGGEELARAIKARRASVPVILITGVPPPGPVDCVDLVVAKPFEMREIADLVARLVQLHAAVQRGPSRAVPAPGSSEKNPGS